MLKKWCKVGRAGLPKNPQALVGASQKLLDDPELRRRMGQLGREKALREFTLDRMLEGTEKGVSGSAKICAQSLLRWHFCVTLIEEAT